MGRLLALGAVLLSLATIPAASARSQHVERQQGIGAGVATSIAAEIAKTGIKAAIAHFAPDLTKHVDPVAYGLAQIQEQLAQLDAKITELGNHQEALEEHLNCVIQRTGLIPVVSRAQSWLESLTYAGNLPTTEGRSLRFDGMFREINAMGADQLQLHTALVGPDGAIRACARHIETGMKPFLTSLLAPAVRDFYATYHAAEVALLVVRVNLMALHPAQFTDEEVLVLGQRVEKWSKDEAGLIKPAFPDTMSYDKQTETLWHVNSIPHAAAALRSDLRAHGWHVTGFDTTPTCSAIEAFIRKSGTSGRAALTWLAQRNVIGVAGDFVGCYDDHDHLHDYDLVTSTYYYAGNVSRYPPALAARQNNGLVDISHYSYLLG